MKEPSDFLQKKLSYRKTAALLPTIFTVGLSLSLLAGCGGSDNPFSSSSNSSASAWSHYRGDAKNTGRGTGRGATGVQRWQFQTGAPIFSTPAIAADGTVYAGSLDGKLYALDGLTGAVKWAFQTGGPIEEAGPGIGPDGTVYVGSDDHKMYALDPKTGTKKWEFLTTAIIFSSPSFGRDGTVYFGSFFLSTVGANGAPPSGPFDGNVYAVNGKTGALKWKYQTASAVGSTAGIGSDGTVYIGSNDGNVYALDGATGQLKWKFVTGDIVEAAPAIGPDGTIYVGSKDHKMYALNPDGSK
jgi:outer membrane protein assembly factor BamB